MEINYNALLRAMKNSTINNLIVSLNDGEDKDKIMEILKIYNKHGVDSDVALKIITEFSKLMEDEI